MRFIKTILVFILGVVVGSFFPQQSKDFLAKTRDRIFTRERAAEVEVIDLDEPQVRKTAKKVTQKASVLKRVRPTTDIYTVQVASFKEVAQANEMVNTLIKEEYNAYVAPVDLEKRQGWYRVCVGESSTMEQAKQYLTVLKPRFKDSFVQSF